MSESLFNKGAGVRSVNTSDLVTFTEEIFSRKLHCLCSANCAYAQYHYPEGIFTMNFSNTLSEIFCPLF